MRIRFKNHFSVPKNIKTATIAYFHGVAFWDSVRAISKSNSVKSPKRPFELNFVADGILVHNPTFQKNSCYK